MPHLDANALTDDPKGMDFLAAVIGRPPADPIPSTIITITDASLDLPGSMSADTVLAAPRARLRRSRKIVPEAA